MSKKFLAAMLGTIAGVGGKYAYTLSKSAYSDNEKDMRLFVETKKTKKQKKKR